MKSVIEKDDVFDDDIIVLTASNGKEVEFIEIAGIAYCGKFYAILQPVELVEGMSADEALIFEVTKGVDGSDEFRIETDDDIIEAVFEEYNKLCDEENA